MVFAVAMTALKYQEGTLNTPVSLHVYSGWIAGSFVLPDGTSESPSSFVLLRVLTKSSHAPTVRPLAKRPPGVDHSPLFHTEHCLVT